MKKNYRLFMADGGGGVAKDFDYAQVEAALTSIGQNITNIENALSTKITVTSYTGSAQGAVESAVDSIRTYLATMKQPLEEMRAKIDEVRNAYSESETAIAAAMEKIAGGSTGTN